MPNIVLGLGGIHLKRPEWLGKSPMLSLFTLAKEMSEYIQTFQLTSSVKYYTEEVSYKLLKCLNTAQYEEYTAAITHSTV